MVRGGPGSPDGQSLLALWTFTNSGFRTPGRTMPWRPVGLDHRLKGGILTAFPVAADLYSASTILTSCSPSSPEGSGTRSPPARGTRRTHRRSMCFRCGNVLTALDAWRRHRSRARRRVNCAWHCRMPATWLPERCGPLPRPRIGRFHFDLSPPAPLLGISESAHAFRLSSTLGTLEP